MNNSNKYHKLLQKLDSYPKLISERPKKILVLNNIQIKDLLN